MDEGLLCNDDRCREELGGKCMAVPPPVGHENSTHYPGCSKKREFDNPDTVCVCVVRKYNSG